MILDWITLSHYNNKLSDFWHPPIGLIKISILIPDNDESFIDKPEPFYIFQYGQSLPFDNPFLKTIFYCCQTILIIVQNGFVTST